MKVRIGLIFSGILITLACRDQGNPIDGRPPCGYAIPSIICQAPYDSPVWYPTGQFIGFNHTPLIHVTFPYGRDCPGEQQFDYDSTGFWLINADGSNIRRIFPYTLQTPAWSPDGRWIAFVLGGQICRMRFDGTRFDTTTVERLTANGSNFFPDWSPNGEWIAYNQSTCQGPNTCGVWMVSSEGGQTRFLADYGNYPNWSPLGDKLLYWTVAVNHGGQTIGDSLWSFSVTTNATGFLAFVDGRNHDSRHARYSPDASKIAYYSSNNLWLMDSIGVNQLQLTTQGVDVSFGSPFSWSPDGNKIVYTSYRSQDWGYGNGVLWILNIRTGEKNQLTINQQP